MGHMWETEWNIQSKLSFHCGFWSTELRSSGLRGKCFYQLCTGPRVLFLKYMSVITLHSTLQRLLISLKEKPIKHLSCRAWHFIQDPFHCLLKCHKICLLKNIFCLLLPEISSKKVESFPFCVFKPTWMQQSNMYSIKTNRDRVAPFLSTASSITMKAVYLSIYL